MSGQFEIKLQCMILHTGTSLMGGVNITLNSSLQSAIGKITKTALLLAAENLQLAESARQEWTNTKLGGGVLMLAQCLFINTQHRTSRHTEGSSNLGSFVR